LEGNEDETRAKLGNAEPARVKYSPLNRITHAVEFANEVAAIF
jgi:hypothetical protein